MGGSLLRVAHIAGILGVVASCVGTPSPDKLRRPQAIALVADDYAAIIGTNASKVGKPGRASSAALSVSLTIVGGMNLPDQPACQPSVLSRRFREQALALSEASGLRLTVSPPATEADINIVLGDIPRSGDDPPGVPLVRWREVAKARVGSNAGNLSTYLL
jgi:hypothetical protein